MRTLLGIALFVLTFHLSALPADACACCSNRGSRYVAVEKLDQSRTVQIEQMTFAEEAFMAVGEGDVPEPLQASQIGTQFRLSVARSPNEIAFLLRDPMGRGGTITLALPKTISIFEVDPFGDAKDEGLGPSLYKEWRLTARAAGGGAFRPLLGGRQQLTLIFHGRGHGCTEALHFTDWTLLVHGPAGRMTLYGALTSGWPKEDKPSAPSP